jgi:hypothetical protein
MAKQPKDHMLLPVVLVQNVLNYLTSRPWIEVNPLVQQLVIEGQRDPVEGPKPPKPEPEPQANEPSGE